MTKEYLFGVDGKGGALRRTPGVSEDLIQKISKSHQTRYTVVKDSQTGASVTKALTKDKDLGVGSDSEIGEVVIIELSAKE